MHAQIGQSLKRNIAELKEDIKASEEQLSIYRKIKKGTIVYAEALLIYVARSGVGEWLPSYKPALLKYTDWTFCSEGYALEFDVLASQDLQPYSPPYQPEYSGSMAQIRGPKYYVAKKIKIVPSTDLPLYINYAHTTSLFGELLKG